MSGADSLSTVALRPWPTPAKEALSKEDVFAQVGQLTVERKQWMRDITEQTLLDDMAAGRGGVLESVEDGKQGAKEEALSQVEMMEKLGLARMEVHNKLEWASFAAGNALNLVSLILSRDLAKHPGRKESDNAYTPMFQAEKVPRSSVGLVKEALAEEDPSQMRPEERARVEHTQRRKVLAMKGSRMAALDWATDTLLTAATDLEASIRNETKYWDEILSISDKGWQIQRTRRGVRNAPFAVKYGPAEASNHFRARGLAPLRMDKEGDIILDPALTLKPKTLRVRISDNAKIIGTSQATLRGALNELAIEKSIQLARASLFEEEMFYEMSIESRNLLSFGVELRGTVLHVPVPGEHSTHRKILIDCIAQDDGTGPSAHSGSQDWLAHDVAEGLRILLAHEHRMRLLRRTRLPAPMTQHKRQQPPPPLLRTLLAMLSHLNAVDSLYAYLRAIANTLKSAGLDVVLEATRELTWERLTETIKEATAKDLTATDQLLASLIRPFEGKATLSLPSSTESSPESITISTRTFMGPPHFGTEHKITLPPSLVQVLNLEHDPQRQMRFTNAEEVKSYLDWIISLDISQTLLFKEFGARSVIKSSEPCISVVTKNSKKSVIKEDDVEIELANAALKATATAQGQLATGAAVESFTWNGSSGRQALKEKVKSWLG